MSSVKVLMVVAFAMMALLTGCNSMKAIPKATPIPPSPSLAQHSGKFVWHDLLTSDLENAKTFYGSLFGWTFNEVDDYTVVLHKGKAIAGMVQLKTASRPKQNARWLASLSVADVEKATAAATAAGGVVLEGPNVIENRGRYALVRDPGGAQVVLLRAISGDPEDSVAEIGAWLWDELWTDDTTAAIHFYRNIAGYNTIADNSGYNIAVNQETWRAGIRPIVIKDMRPLWIPVIRVHDPEAIAKQAETLGGHILITPSQTDGSAPAALIADPTGGVVMVQSWSAGSQT
jgi:uncharacterized protein